jgi:hypothetical protein
MRNESLDLEPHVKVCTSRESVPWQFIPAYCLALKLESGGHRYSGIIIIIIVIIGSTPN